MRFLSSPWSIARGSIGGTTYLANQFHALIARQRVSPVQPNTPSQALVKSALSFAAQQWKGLTLLDRNLWDAYAQTVVFQGPLGPYSVPGRQLFIGGLAFVNLINGSGIDTIVVDTSAPLLAGRLNLGNVVPGTFTTPADTGVAVNFDNPTSSDYVVVVQRSIGFDPSRIRYKGPFLPATAQAISLPGPATGLAEFGGLVAGANYFIHVRAVVENEPARYSERYIVLATAVTNP